LPQEGAAFTKDSATVDRNISLGGEQAGAIAIISDLDALQAKIRQYTEISAAVIFASLLATFLVSSRLMRLITGPIWQLAEITGRFPSRRITGYGPSPAATTKWEH
jgi:hypothetical protein